MISCVAWPDQLLRCVRVVRTMMTAMLCGLLQNDIDLDSLVEVIRIDLQNKLDWMDANISPSAV